MSYHYVGTELDLFAEARHWKAYVRRRVAPYLGRRVLEVGAGHGGTTRALCSAAPEDVDWVCLEPDLELAGRLSRSIEAGELPPRVRVRVGTLADVEPEPGFDSILYMDVLEHIEDDRAELAEAAERLAPGGFLVVLSPSHQWLFSPFDEALGHHRRYSRKTLAAVGPPALRRVRLDDLDAVGLLASLGNALLLRSAMPTRRQIALWDRVMVPASTVLDPLLGRRLGKSLLAVWRRPSD